MIKPYYKHEHTATKVVVEDFGAINLNNLPIRVSLEKEGRYEIGWTCTREDGKDVYILSEYGGKNSLDYAGRFLGVKDELD